MKEILMIHTRELCYFSGGFFLDRMQESLEGLGAKVTKLSLAGDKEHFDILENYVGRHYDGVLDVNSKLPYLVLEEKGDYLLDKIDAPFFNYILDHPLYHHPGLQFPLKNYHAIGIDQKHCAYMRTYYPHLQSVSYLTIAGTRAWNQKKFSERKYPVLFSGTYEDENRFLPMLQHMGEEVSVMGQKIIPIMLQNDIAMEDAVRQIMGDKESTYSFPEFMNRLYPVDKYVRNYRRNQLLLTVAKRGIPLTILGEGWENSALAGYANVCILPPTTIARSFEVIADSRILIDINPFFHQGIHDRVTTAMANGTLCITNASPKADTLLQDGETIRYYTQGNGEQLADALEEMLHMTLEEQETMAERAFEYYEKEYSWEAHGRKLLNVIAKATSHVK